VIIIVGHNVNQSRTTKTISARVMFPLYRKIEDLANEEFNDKSNFIENAIMFYFDHLDDIEISEQL